MPSIKKRKAAIVDMPKAAPADRGEFDAVSQDEMDEIMKNFDRESNTRIWTGWQEYAVKGVMAAFSLIVIYITLFATMLDQQRLPSFVGMGILMGYLVYPAKKGKQRINYIPWYDLLIMILGTGAYFYFVFNARTIIKQGIYFQWYEYIIGIIGILSLVELCRRSVGVPILCVAAVFVGYGLYFFTQKLGFVGAAKTLIYRIFYTTTGIFTTPIDVCSKYIAVFIIFGAFLERTGISDFFIQLANSLAGSASGGPAKVAVISSALCGMVSGSSVGNTVTTGSVTIPMMKKTGYKPEFAGAVEAAASTGGQIMPPIMGAAAFLMAEYMGLPYAQVAVKAILPAVLYFAGIFIAVHLEAKKLGLQGIPRDQLPKWKLLARDCYLILPLVLLVYLVASGSKTMSHSAAYSILAAVAVGGVNFFLTRLRGSADRPAQKPGPALAGAGKDTFFSAVDALEAGSKGAITVAVACAMAGIIAGCITVTGLASILINAIVRVAGNATIVGLVLTMLCCIVLGMGVPTTANYCIMASTCAPILVQLGFPVVAAHFFVFYFGIVADITPPVALAAYAGSAIARSDPMKTGVNATRLAIAAFVVPYIFAMDPTMMFVGIEHWYQVALICLTSVVGIYGVAAGLAGFTFKEMPWYVRILSVAGGLMLLAPSTLTDIIGFALVAAVVLGQYLWSKKSAPKAA